jgi:Uma2 family endonuclease
MGMPATERRWTRAEVLDLIARNPLHTPRYELVDGVLLVTPAPTNRHQLVVARVLWLLTQYLESEPGIGTAIASPADVKLEPEVTVGPDVFVVPAHEAKRIWQQEGPVHELLLAVEVLSPGDRSGDRGRKRLLYQRRVPEYWIVDIPSRHFELWRPHATSPVIHAAQLEWHPAGAKRPFSLDIKSFFDRLRGED